jgi:hypothetical protein
VVGPTVDSWLRGASSDAKTGTARVYAGLDPITKKPIQLYGRTRATETEPAKDIAGLLRTAEAGRHPDRSATVDYLFERWLAVADFELNTRVANEGYIARTLSPTISSYALRKLQDGVDILDRLYAICAAARSSATASRT